MTFKIAYCAGHYLHTAGKRLPKALDPKETREWVLNDRVADYFAQAAQQYPEVELLRTDDYTGEHFVDIPVRCAKANAWGANLYLDFHHNAAGRVFSGGGVEAFCYPGSTEGKKYRDAIYAAVIAAGGLKGNRSQPLREKAFDSLRLAKATAVLIEYGYMDSKVDAPIILTEAYAKKVGYATMEAIAQTKGLKKAQQAAQPEQKPAAKPDAKPAAEKKTVAEIASEVIAGKWGNGEDRKRKLEAAGYDYAEVQAAVNAALSGKKPATTQKSINTLATEVIAGKWGTGADRKKRLEAAGYDYAAVQKRVNEILR